MKRYRTCFMMLPARDIFGSVGRSGGGYNTMWSDWSAQGRQRRDVIMAEYEQAMDQLCGHYQRLESSILAEGIRNPLIVTCGAPRRRTWDHMPPEMRQWSVSRLLIMETLTGGSRLWVAQKHNMVVPALINDWTGRFSRVPEITTIPEAMQHYRDPPRSLTFDNRLGLVEAFDQHKIGHHLGAEWSEDRLMPLRAPIWVGIMNRHGYRVDRLPPAVTEILARAGIDQKNLGR